MPTTSKITYLTADALMDAKFGTAAQVLSKIDKIAKEFSYRHSASKPIPPPTPQIVHNTSQ